MREAQGAYVRRQGVTESRKRGWLHAMGNEVSWQSKGVGTGSLPKSERGGQGTLACLSGAIRATAAPVSTTGTVRWCPDGNRGSGPV